MLDLESLNPAQREAVETTEGPLLVLAGAGSGKTRVLTYRIAHLVEDLGVAPWNILAVTFTNKAATEMRERLHKLIGSPASAACGSTRSTACACACSGQMPTGWGSRKTSRSTTPTTPSASIKSIMSDNGYNTKTLSENTVRSRISAAKNELVGPDDYVPRVGDPADKAVARIYRTYQQRLLRANALDFDDLLFYTYILLRDNTDVRDEYGRAFQVHSGRRVPRHQQGTVRNHEDARARQRKPHGRRRRRPVHLLVARCRHPQHSRLRARLARDEDGQARAELPLDGQYPQRGQRRHREQSLAQVQAPVHRRPRRRQGRRVPGGRRARRGTMDRVSDREAARRGRVLRRDGGVLPDQRAVAYPRGHVPARGRALPHRRGHEVLRPCRGSGT